jgi:transcriptional regulator with XRE-family HTH domain
LAWEDSGLTQENFSSALGITSVSLQNYMKGVRTPDANIVVEIAKMRNIRLEWLMTGEGPMKPDGETVRRAGELVLTKIGEKALRDIYDQLVGSQAREIELLREKIGALQEENNNLKEQLSLFVNSAESNENTA